MKNCKNCIHYTTRDICAFCTADTQNWREIPLPFFKGGPKRCKCYKQIEKSKNKFEYPTEVVRYNPPNCDSSIKGE